MKIENIGQYLNSFNEFVYTAGDIEFWFARDLQFLLGYKNWENFEKVIDKAKVTCSVVGVSVEDNFANTSRVVDMPNGGIREIDDMFLTRYACYLIAQNGDSAKEEVSFAMNYFAVQTRRQEILEQRINDQERLQARDKLSISEKDLSGAFYERGTDKNGFGLIKSKGDQALFGGLSTNEMKSRLKVPVNRPLADFLPTITIKAKDFANEITIFNLKKDKLLTGLNNVAHEHTKNNYQVRNLLLQRGIRPEELPAEEDAKKLKRRIESEDKRLMAGKDGVHKKYKRI